MAVPVIASSTSDTTGGTNNTTVVLTEPSGLAVDDLIILIFADEQANVNDCPDLSAQGFARITHADNSHDCQMAIYWKICDGTESWPITVAGTSGDYAVGWALRITGVDTTTPIHKTGAWYGVGSAGATAVPAEVTTEVIECLGIAVACYDGADVAPASVSGTGWSLIGSLEDPSNDSNGAAADYATKSIDAIGGSAACTFTMSASDGRVAIQFAIAPSAGGETYIKKILSEIDLKDLNQKSMAFKRSVLGVLGVADYTNRLIAYKRLLQEPIDLKDSNKKKLDLKRLFYSAVCLTASNKKNMSYKRQTVSMSNLADSIKRNFTAKRFTFAGIGLDSLAGHRMTMKRSLYGKEDLNDSNKRLFSFKRLVLNVVDLIDSNITKLTTALKKFIFETVDMVEFIEGKIATTVKKIISDTLNIVEGIKKSISLKRHVMSEISIIESLRKGMTYKRIVQSVVGVLDSCKNIVTAIGGLIKAVFDTINIIGSEKRLISFKRLLLSVVSLPELLIRKITYKRMLYAVVYLYEAVARQRPLKKIISETISFVDSITHSIGVTVDVTILKIRQFLFDTIFRHFKFSDKTTTFKKESEIHKMRGDKK